MQHCDDAVRDRSTRVPVRFFEHVSVLERWGVGRGLRLQGSVQLPGMGYLTSVAAGLRNHICTGWPERHRIKIAVWF